MSIDVRVECCLCGSKKNVELMYDGNFLCGDCIEKTDKKYIRCDFCTLLTPENSVRTIGDKHICKLCKSMSFLCEDCGSIITNRDYSHTIDGKQICRSCSSRYSRCVFCGNHEKDVPSERDYYGDQMCVCEMCMEAHRGTISKCSSCGKLVVNENLCGCEWCDVINICPACMEEYHHSCRGECIKPYNYKIKTNFMDEGVSEQDARIAAAVGSRLFLGVELEVDRVKSIPRLARQLTNMSPREKWFALVHDGSLSGHGASGLEIVTQPCTVAFHLNSYPWNEISDICKKNGARSHDTNTCGLHIHVNNSYLVGQESDGTEEYMVRTSKVQARIIKCFNKFWEEIASLSRRTKFDYCKKNGAVSSYTDVISEKSKGKYAAVNVCNENTTEIRIWRGTLNVASIKALVEITAGIVTVAKKSTVKEINNMDFDTFMGAVLTDTKYATDYVDTFLLN